MVTITAHDWRIASYIAMNMVSSISIVVVNKVIYKDYGFQYVTFLTMLHFIATAAGLQLCAWFKLFSPKKLDVKKIYPLVGSFCGFVVLTNLSLRYNSLGFFQVMKIMTTPTIVIIQQVLFDVHLPRNMKLALAPVCVGVAIATVTDVQFNIKGFFFASMGVLVTSAYQILTGSKQKDLRCNSMQLLYYQAPMASALLFVLLPVLDEPGKAMSEEYSAGLVFFILLSCAMAFLVNLSIFLVIGETSPVTYNVMGHCKTIIVLFCGFMLFGDPVHAKNLMGIVITIAGIVWYSKLKLEQRRRQEEEAKASEAVQLVASTDGAEAEE